jgi:uncharacterized protein (UPF0333 family)
MKKYQGGGALGIVIGLVFLAGILGIAGIVVASYFSAYNYGNQTEQNLKATQQQNKNILAQYGQKVMEVAQVPTMMRDDLVKVTNAAIQGRYGQDGSKATFQWLKEQNPNLDSSLYKQIQQVIEAGRNDFQNGQERQIDLVRQYQTALGSIPRGWFLTMAGYPKINLDDFKIVSTDRADTAFQTKKEAPIDLIHNR